MQRWSFTMATHLAPALPGQATRPAVRPVLLVCGILSSLVYVAANVVGALRWEGYDSVSQAVSELSALGAPSRSWVTPIFLAYDMLFTAFALGVEEAARKNPALRVSGVTLLGIAIVNWLAAFFPMHVREAPKTFTDTMHIVVTAVTSLLVLLSIGFAAKAFGRAFRVHSLLTLAVLVAFGLAAAAQGPAVAANLPTPSLGLLERINIGAFLLWVAVTSIATLRLRDR